MKTAAEYLSLARTLLAQGFATKAARKDAIEYVTRAFDCAKADITNALLAPGVDRSTDIWKKLYYGLPDCHVWKAKHAELFAAYPACRRLTECAELRATIKAAPDVAKKPREKTAKEIARDASAKECQICGRPIFAELGVIAHHGYQRPGQGWQTQSCHGARELPYEVTANLLASHVATQREVLAAMKTARADVTAEHKGFRVYWEVATGKRDAYGRTEYESFDVNVTRDTWEAVTHATPEARRKFHDCFEARHTPGGYGFDYWKARDIAERNAQIANQAQYVEWQSGRLAAWKPVLTWCDGWHAVTP